VIVALVAALACVQSAQPATSAVPSDFFASDVETGADFDGDAVPDLMIEEIGAVADHAVEVWLVAGHDRRVLRSFRGTDCARLLDDVDGDHRTDVLFVRWQDDRAAVHLEAVSSRTGEIVWTFEKRAQPGDRLSCARIGDCDGDGARDLAITCTGADKWGSTPITLAVLSARERVELAHFEFERGRDATSIIADAGDVDSDERPDLLIVTSGDAGASATMYSIARNRALFTVRPKRGERRFGIGACAGRDLNGDGTPDFVIASAVGGHKVEKLQWVRNPSRIHAYSGRDGTLLGTWFSPQDEDGTSFGSSMTFVDDLDGDGKPEILVGDGDSGLFCGAAYLFSSRGEILRRIATSADDWHFGRVVCAAGDLDRDGASDYVIASTPFCLGETGAVRAFSGRTGDCLWTITRATISGTSATSDAPR
jgi:hypothetical protein